MNKITQIKPLSNSIKKDVGTTLRTGEYLDVWI